MRRMMVVITALLLLIMPQQPAVQSQASSTCPQLVTLALEATDQSCEELGSNQACYGHVRIDASPRAGVTGFRFRSTGDVAALHEIATFRLSSMNPDAGTWGVALINVMAYLQYAAPEAVTFLLFGDVELENLSPDLTSVEMQVRPGYYANARISPYASAGVVEVLPPGQIVEARARTASGEWVLVMLPDTRRLGWIFTAVLSTEGDIDDLVVDDGTGKFFGPMQAFSFQSGEDDAPCPESPESGLLIQTPEGVAEVTLLVNEVTIDMQATLFLQAQPGEDFSIMVVDGWAEVEVNGFRQPVFAGSRVTVPLSETGGASGLPSMPEPYDLGALQSLPVGNLGSPVEVSEPLSEDQIAALVGQWESTQVALYGPTTTTTTLSSTGSTGSTTGTTGTGSSTTTLTGETSTGDTVTIPGTDPVPPDTGGGTTDPPPPAPTQEPTPDPGFLPPGHGGTPPGQNKKG